MSETDVSEDTYEVQEAAAEAPPGERREPQEAELEPEGGPEAGSGPCGRGLGHRRAGAEGRPWRPS